MAQPIGPSPKTAINPTCQICGSAVYCGAGSCPSSSLQVGYDGIPQNSETYISVTVFWPGISGGIKGPAF
jgi:hypothetical protein